MKRAIIIAAVLAASIANGQMFAQLFGGETWTPAALNPIAWYKGENNAADSIGSYNGTWNGSEAYAAGKVGYALVPAPDDRVGISIPSNAAPTTLITVSAWIKHNKASGIGWVVSQPYGPTWAGPYVNFGLATNGSNVLWRVTTHALATTSRPIYAGTFFHVVCVRSAAKMSIYVNGALVIDANTTGALQAAPTQPVAIGYISPQPASEVYSGLIDDVLIFDRALTATEIKKLYDESVLKNGGAW